MSISSNDLRSKHLSGDAFRAFLSRRYRVLLRWSERHPDARFEESPLAPNTLRDLVTAGRLKWDRRGRLVFA